MKNDGFIFGGLRYFFGVCALIDIFISMSNEYPVFVEDADVGATNLWIWICALSWIVFLGYLWHYLFETPKKDCYLHIFSGICNIACIDWAINSISVAFPYAGYIRVTVPVLMLLSAILIKLKQSQENQKEIIIQKEIYKELVKLNTSIEYLIEQQKAEKLDNTKDADNVAEAEE